MTSSLSFQRSALECSRGRSNVLISVCVLFDGRALTMKTLERQPRHSNAERWNDAKILSILIAEEEAASCLFYTLKNQKYKNSEKLQFKDHTYKQALYPHIISIRNHFTEIELNEYYFGENFYLEHFEYNNRKALRLHLTMPNIEMIATPIPPLHFSITSPDTGKAITFERNFKETYQGEQFATALKYVKHIANERNQILYASEKGSLRISGDITPYLEEQKRKVFTILHIMLLTDPWIDEGHSAFVQQALDSFLLLLEKIRESEMCLPNNDNSN